MNNSACGIIVSSQRKVILTELVFAKTGLAFHFYRWNSLEDPVNSMTENANVFAFLGNLNLGWNDQNTTDRILGFPIRLHSQ